MNNANLSQEISRLYKDLSDHILARDGAGASRIYQELLRAGQSLEMLARVSRLFSKLLRNRARRSPMGRRRRAVPSPGSRAGV